MTKRTTIDNISIDKLLLDAENPRFGGNTGKTTPQKSLLENIVDKHGINDLLTSMSANGYFKAEPVVAIPQDDGKYTVVEGNRRLATALILTRSDRAASYTDIAERYLTNDNKDKVASLKILPVSVSNKREELIAYLGAKHIRGSKPWDSYAKAHWLFELMSVSRSELTIGEAARLVGDQNATTVKRILEAYILMQQLKNKKNYQSEHSIRKGRGSNPDYPFSWIYTAIGYENIRNWIGIEGLDSKKTITADVEVLKSPESFSNSEKLVKFLFGSSVLPLRPAIKESRGIRYLNDVVTDDESVRELEDGKDVEEVWENQRSVDDRLGDLFYRVKENLKTINTLVASEELSQEDMTKFRKTGKTSLRLLETILKTLQSKL